MVSLVGQTISHYKILERLGAGGMGEVYKAEDIKLKRIVGLKFITPSVTTDPDAKERFSHEAQAASALDHPNVCNIHEIGETDDGQLFIAMACYDGETLKKKIERGPLPIDDSVSLAMQVAGASPKRDSGQQNGYLVLGRGPLRDAHGKKTLRERLRAGVGLFDPQ